MPLNSDENTHQIKYSYAHWPATVKANFLPFRKSEFMKKNFKDLFFFYFFFSFHQAINEKKKNNEGHYSAWKRYEKKNQFLSVSAVIIFM